MAQSQAVSLGSVLRAGGFGQITPDAQRKLIEWDNKLQKTIDQQGQILGAIQNIADNAGVGGRATTLQAIIGHLSDSGNLASTDNIVSDGTGSPLTGGKRAAVAIDTNNRLTDSFRQNPVDVSCSPTGTADLSNDGVTTAITIASGSYRFGPGLVNYNSGSVDPGSFGGPYYIYFDDPKFQGGAVTFQFSSSPVDTVGALGRIPCGSITTVSSSAVTGGGYTGGSGGHPGGRGGGNPN